MPKNSFLKAIFPGPKYSVSQIEKNNKGNTRIGQIIPVYKTMLNPGEKVRLDLGHLVRFAPTVVPTMEGYEVNFEAFCVPLTALAYAQRKERDIMDFHNIALNDGTEVNPFCKALLSLDANGNIYLDPRRSGKLSDFFRKGLLGDYLNLPSFKNFRAFVRRWINEVGLFEGGLFNKFEDDDDNPVTDYSDVFVFVHRVLLNNIIDSNHTVTLDGSGRGAGMRVVLTALPFPASPSSLSSWVNYDFANDAPPSGTFFGTSFLPEDSAGIYSDVMSFPMFLMNRYPLLASYYGLPVLNNASAVTNFLNHLLVMREANALDLDYLGKLYEFYKIDAQSAFDEYFEYVVGQLLYNPDLYLNGDENQIRMWDESSYLPAKPVESLLDLSYFAAYWKIISDWYINTNIDGDPNEFFINHAGAILGDDENELPICLEPFNRRWNNDPFTSSVPVASVTNVAIPVDGTIPDLREANAYQRLVDILRNTGKRIRDVVRGIRGISVDAGASDMSVPVGALHSFVGMQSVLQTSATTKESPQASYSGIGTDSTRGDYRRLLKVVNKDEAVPVVVMVLMSVTQRSTYFQGLPRYFAERSSIYDFAIPQLANIGEQEIYLSELFCDYNDGVSPADNSIFGFNRRYYDWFFEDNEIHGDMRDTEDFWHGARVFSSKPSLNSEFIGIDTDRDELQRIFANLSPVAMPIYYNCFFEGEKVVALPRYIQYEL